MARRIDLHLVHVPDGRDAGIVPDLGRVDRLERGGIVRREVERERLVRAAVRQVDPDEGLARRVPRVDLVVEEVAVGIGEAEAGAAGTAVGIVEPVDRGREADKHREVLQVIAAGVAGDGEHELLRE